jgi:hypothetical protein
MEHCSQYVVLPEVIRCYDVAWMMRSILEVAWMRSILEVTRM